MKLHLRILCALAFSIFAMSAKRASACRCIQPPEVSVARDEAAAVFEGSVVSDEETEGMRRITFAVTQMWKGVSTERVVVETEGGNSSCRVEFPIGQSFLVYAARAEEGAALSVGPCTRTHQLSADDTDRQELGAGEIPVEIRDEPAPVAPARTVAPSSRGCGCSLPTRSSNALASMAFLLGLVLARTKLRRAKENDKV